MPTNTFGKFKIEIRTNEHNHKKQRAHLHVYINGIEVASIFLDGELRDGKMKAKDLKKIRAYLAEHAERYQAMWDEYQNSEY